MTERPEHGAGRPENPIDRANAEAFRVYDAVPQFGRIRKDTLLADVWDGPELSPRDRSIVTCTVLAVAGRTDELGAHLRKAVSNGITADEIRGMVVQVAFYAGWPAGLGLGKAALSFLEGEG